MFFFHTIKLLLEAKKFISQSVNIYEMKMKFSSFHFISAVHIFLLREHMNPQLTCSQRQWLHSSVSKASHR